MFDTKFNNSTIFLIFVSIIIIIKTMSTSTFFYFSNKSWSNSNRFSYIDVLTNWSFHLLYTAGTALNYMNTYVNRLLLPFSSTTSIIGFMLLLTIGLQLISGFFLGWLHGRDVKPPLGFDGLWSCLAHAQWYVAVLGFLRTRILPLYHTQWVASDCGCVES